MVLIYFVLVLLFNNLGQPLIVMITVPFGVIGAMLTFVLHGVTLSFLGVIGIIGLSGVVVNDSIVMVDFINKLIKTAGDRNEFKTMVALGASKRLRPVVLTTLTTVAGLMPTVYGLGGYSGLLVPITMAMAYGLLFATTLTLFFIPSLYMVQLDFKGFIHDRLKKADSNRG